MTELMQQPSWSKLSANLNTLIEQPWKFGLFKALNLLESEWAERDELQDGLSRRVLITPNKELGYPVSDIKQAQLVAEERGLIHVQTNYSGLYGADAAMPHYVLEQAGEDSEPGARTRAFLDIFNHLYYCQLYQSWKKSQLNIKGLGAEQFDLVLDSILPDRQDISSNAGVAVLKSSSACGMEKLLNDEFASEQIRVDDSRPHWQPIAEGARLGDSQTTVLGESLILGSQVLVSGGRVIIELGCLAQQYARSFFPGAKHGDKLYKLVQSQLPSDLPWECHMSIEHDFKPSQRLGDEHLVLGVSSHIGDVSRTTELQKFKDSQYQQRMASIT